MQVYSIVRSPIYQEEFQFQLVRESTENKVVFYKTSVLKTTPVTIYYEIHLLSLNSLQKLKKTKVEHQDIRKFGFSCG